MLAGEFGILQAALGMESDGSWLVGTNPESRLN